MLTFGVYNIKGGAGKTTSAVNLAYLSAASGFKTLLWDLDPQGAASYYLNRADDPDINVRKVVKGKVSIDDVVRKTDFKKLRIIPSDFDFRNIDITLDDLKKSRSRLREALKELRDKFDIVFLDSPPGISLLSENIFKAADFLLVPIIPTPLSMRTLEQINSFYKENELDQAGILPFFSMTQERKSIHKESIGQVTASNPNVCQNRIPFAAEVGKMGVRKKPVNARTKLTRAGLAYSTLWREICQKASIVLPESSAPQTGAMEASSDIALKTETPTENENGDV